MNRSLLLSLATAVALAAGIAFAQNAPTAAPASAPAATAQAIDWDAAPPIRPAIQNGNNSPQAHEQLLAKAKLGAGKIDVYFQGDSITRRWGALDYPKY